MYNNYIIGFYDTLVDIDTDEYKDNLWSDLAVFLSYQGAVYTPDELKNRYEKIIKKLTDMNSKKIHHDIDFQDVIYLIYKEKGIKAKNKQLKYTAQVFRMLSLNSIKLYEGALDFLEALKSAGKNIYLLANAQRCFLMPELKMLGIKDYFTDIKVSSDEGMAKPNPKLFTELIESNDLKAKKTVAIGSRYDIDIQGAIDAGIDTLLFRMDDLDIKDKQLKCTYKVDGMAFDQAKELLIKS